MRNIFVLVVCTLSFLSSSYPQAPVRFSFKDVWSIFNTPFSKLDSFFNERGYTSAKRDNTSIEFIEVKNKNSIKVNHTYYDSVNVSGMSFVLKEDEILPFAEDLKSNTFVPHEPSATLTTNNYKNSGITELESVRYFLECSILSQYPVAGKYDVNFISLELLWQGIPVIKKGNNKYLTSELEAELISMIHEPFDSGLFIRVSEKPVFRGGSRGMYIYLNKNVRYPEPALQDSIEAALTVEYEIDEKGKVARAKVIKGGDTGHGLPEEAIRLFMEMPLWRPGRQMGKIVSFEGEQIIYFKIKPAR
jgi:protein TonB